MWEDEWNKSGGKISIKLKKDYTTIIWEEMILAMIGGVLPQSVKDEINGVVVSIRKEFNLLQIWFKNFTPNVTSELEQTLKDLLQIPEGVELDTKQFFRR
jgi:translation initiation factor 4E